MTVWCDVVVTRPKVKGGLCSAVWVAAGGGAWGVCPPLTIPWADLCQPPGGNRTCRKIRRRTSEL